MQTLFRAVQNHTDVTSQVEVQESAACHSRCKTRIDSPLSLLNGRGA